MSAEYAPSAQPRAARGGVIAAIESDSPAMRAGLLAGDAVLRAEGRTLRDIIDWQWLSDGDTVRVDVERSDGDTLSTQLQRTVHGSSWGIGFRDAVFDGVRTCRNNCAFCFMTQLPKGLRSALYLRDDDYRLSFLQGNFITLTNLADGDVERISEQHISPLYVSLHAVDPDVRRELVCAREDRALERFDQLLAEGIDLHAQIVLVPGVNDGDQLEHTLSWLAEREGVLSIGIVPLGYTRHQQRFRTSYNDSEAAAAVIRQVERWQSAMRERDGVTWVYLADEFYLNAAEAVPSATFYDEFPQYENGIGIARSFIDDVDTLLPRLKSAIARLPEDAPVVTVISGTLAAATVADALLASDVAGRVRVAAVPNLFFGGNVSVTGLLTGEDMLAWIRDQKTDGVWLLPDVVLNADGVTLDGMTIDDLRDQSGADLRLVSSDAAGLLTGLEMVGAELA